MLLLSGAYSTAATKQHFGMTYRILELGLRYSVPAMVSHREVDDRCRYRSAGRAGLHSQMAVGE
jgi:hypothetical protein